MQKRPRGRVGWRGGGRVSVSALRAKGHATWRQIPSTCELVLCLIKEALGGHVCKIIGLLCKRDYFVLRLAYLSALTIHVS